MIKNNLTFDWWKEIMYLIRHAGNGVINTIVGFIVIFSAMGLGFSPIVSNVAGYAVGFVLGFVISKKFVFRSNGHFVTESIRYLIAFAISFAFNLLVLRFALLYSNLHVMVSQAVAAVAYTLLMYLLTRFFVFNPNISIMKKEFMLFDRKLELSPSYIRLLSVIFVVAVLSKGSVIFRGFAIDDYVFTSEVDSTTLNFVISQGRYIAAAVMWIFNSLSINMNDMYFSFGIATLLLYSVFIVSILRFVGMKNSPAAGLVGGIMVAHPYLTEIFTFRILLPYYSVALIFSIAALEIIIKSPTDWRTRVLALLATLAMLLTYQVFLNYFAVIIIFAFVFGQILHNNQLLATNNIYRERAIILTVISAISAITFVIIMRLAKVMGLANMAGRTSFIAFDEIPERTEQILSALVKIYWSAEPVFSGWLKILIALLLIVSVVIILWCLLTDKNKKNSISNLFITVFAFLLLIPVSLGIIVALKDWWPVPRVISHVAVIIGLTFLLADSCIQKLNIQFLKSTIFLFRIMVLVGFVLLSNQILADQQRVNQWDKMMANRIISRLEMQPNFNNVQFVHISGGTWGYPAKLRTIQGDMNISALYVPYAKAALLSEVSGYDLKWAKGAKVTVGETYCATKKPWPHTESVTIDNDLAIVCLKK